VTTFFTSSAVTFKLRISESFVTSYGGLELVDLSCCLVTLPLPQSDACQDERKLTLAKGPLGKSAIDWPLSSMQRYRLK
jgi:hypothetical protein